MVKGSAYHEAVPELHTKVTSHKSEQHQSHSGLSNTTDDYVRSARKINLLRDIGIEALDVKWLDGGKPDLSLPKVVLVGDQSSGKSSLIESISEIQVPIAEGTCTKCPMEIRLSERGDQWICNVSLRLEPKAEGEHSKIVPFSSTPKKDEVGDILRRAQLAILKPQPKIGELQNTESTAPREFSEDTIIVDIVGASMNFTFIDLPGLINLDLRGPQAQQGFQHAVEKLVTRYLKDPNCLVLLTIPMNYDSIQLGPAMKMAMTLDDKGKRRIGVLTKSDIASERTESYWLQVFHNELFPFEHGYYMTCQRTQEQREEKITHERARENEDNFFKHTHPWCEEPNKMLFGTKNLLRAISGLLSKMITQSLPKLQISLMKHSETVGGELRGMPQLVPNVLAQKTLLDLSGKFIDEIKKYAESNPPIVRNQFDLLAQKLTGTLVKFDVSKESGNKSSVPHPPDFEREALEAEQITEKAVSLGDLRVLISQKRGHEMSHVVPWPAKDFAMKLSISKWKSICLQSFQTIENDLKAIIKKKSNLVFAESHMIKLETDVINAANKILDKVAARTRSLIEAYCDWEFRRPFTQDDAYFEGWRITILGRLCAQRFTQTTEAQTNATLIQPANNRTNSAQRNTANPQAPIPETLKGLIDFTDKITPKPEPELVAMYEADVYRKEIDIVAEAGAYFLVAYKRVIDVIPMCIENEFLVGLGIELKKELDKNLCLVAKSPEEIENTCARYVAEEPALAAQRRKLEETKKTLDNALQIITSSV